MFGRRRPDSWEHPDALEVRQVRAFTPKASSASRTAVLHGCTRPGHDRQSCPVCTPHPDPWAQGNDEALAYGRRLTAERDAINAATRAEIAAGTYRGPLGSTTRSIHL